jgi:ABC-2 type transport system permease protein
VIRPQFWSNVRAIAYRETQILRHDRAIVFSLLFQPVLLLIIFGGVLSNKPQNVPWAVLDRSHTAVSRKLVADVRSMGYFLEPFAVASTAEGRERIHEGQSLALLVIPETFARDVEHGNAEIQLLLDGSDPLSSARVGGYISSAVASFDPRPTVLRADPALRTPGPVAIRQRFRFNPTLNDRDFFLSAIAGMLLTNVCFSATSLGFVGEREGGTYEQVMSLPVTSLEIVIGKLVPHLFIAYALLAGTLLAAGIVFGVWVRGSLFALLLVTLPFVLASLAVGVLVSALARTSAQAIFITVFFTLPSFIMSGIMMPYQLMPHGVREVGGLLPLRWYQIALRRIVERGAGLLEIAVPTFALLVIFAVLLVLIRLRMKPRLG